MSLGGETRPRASALEIVGAWLRIWTPPRDADIPPVPWRKLGLGALAGLVVLGAALAVLVPRIDEGKRERAAADAAERARTRAANRARIVHEQRPRHGADVALRPKPGASAAERAGARAALLARVEASIMADARARAATGEMRPVEGPTTCSVTPGTKVGAFGVYDCFTVVRRIAPTKRTAAGAIGYPFRAVVDYRKFTYTWCKTEQIPGEMLIPDPRTVVQLPAACRAPDDA
jgi:hypothetical protein